MEAQVSVSTDVRAWALACIEDSLPAQPMRPKTQSLPPPLDPPAAVWQHMVPPRRFMLLSAQGSIMFEVLRPLEQLRHLLVTGGGADTEDVQKFFLLHREDQACATSLALACSRAAHDTEVSSWAARAFFRVRSDGTTLLPCLDHDTLTAPSLLGQLSPLSNHPNGYSSSQSSHLSRGLPLFLLAPSTYLIYPSIRSLHSQNPPHQAVLKNLQPLLSLSVPLSPDHKGRPVLHMTSELSLSIFLISFCLPIIPPPSSTHSQPPEFPPHLCFRLTIPVLPRNSNLFLCLISFPSNLIFIYFLCCPIHTTSVFSILVFSPCFPNACFHSPSTSCISHPLSTTTARSSAYSILPILPLKLTFFAYQLHHHDKHEWAECFPASNQCSC
uniref:Uncharacterized protein n=1 Tax=Eptatretus burgeri TaxID=7764 RepID=A0A8C4Q163_EPTBU